MAIESFQSFKRRQLALGADEVVERSWPPEQKVESQTHRFEVDGLVVEGEMWLTCGGERRHLRPGSTFHIAPGVAHDESYGPRGATYWVARHRP